MAKSQWVSLHPKAQCTHDIAVGSDHAPILVNLNLEDCKGRKSFKFKDMWMKNPTCFEIIKSAWERGGRLSRQDHFNVKLKACRTDLSRWSKQVFGNNRAQIDVTKARLHQISAMPATDQLLVEEKTLKSKLHALWKQEEIYWKQRSRVRWLKEGDRNSKFFHLSTMERRRRNKIIKLRDSGGRGVWLDKEPEIMEEIHRFFSGLLGPEKG